MITTSIPILLVENFYFFCFTINKTPSLLDALAIMISTSYTVVTNLLKDPYQLQAFIKVIGSTQLKSFKDNQYLYWHHCN